MKTSWGNVAGWYDEMLEGQDGRELDGARRETYQSALILPNLIRVLSPQRGETILDIACGQGFFSREIAKKIAKTGGHVIASDIADELITLARTHPDPISKDIDYHISSADKLDFCPSESVSAAVIILALQNIENIFGVFQECARVLISAGKNSNRDINNGRLVIVLNHPAFRIPKHSSWQWDEAGHTQYRRIDAYMSDSRERIDMNPGALAQGMKKGKNEKNNAVKNSTISFHRPLQVYFKALAKAGFAVTRLEEWVSHKQSAAGPRAIEENRIRKEIPMFLMIEAKKF
jgi:ubiquinone/menaquinone biosynthesis C-methylase UbiE